MVRDRSDPFHNEFKLEERHREWGHPIGLTQQNSMSYLYCL